MNSHAKVALATGAGSGIGKHVALALVKEGYLVLLTGRRKAPLEATALAGESLGAPPLVVPADVSDAASVRALFAKTEDIFGRLDLLFNNAGIFMPPASLEDVTYEQWKSAIDINCWCRQISRKFNPLKNRRENDWRRYHLGQLLSAAVVLVV